jgi:hypothetical protein
MKIFINILFIFFSFLTFAQNEISGEWILYKIVQNNKIITPYYPVQFTRNGKMLIQGRELANWKKNKQSILFTSENNQLNGTAIIIKLDKKELIYKTKKQAYYYKKYKPETVKNDKIYQKLTGVWKIQGNFITVNKFDDSGEFTQLVTGNGSTITDKARWLYIPDEKSLIIQGDVEVLRGISIIRNINDEYMELEQNGINYQLEKMPVVNKVSHLDFTYDDIEEHPSEPTDLPWNDENLYDFLSSIKNINYQKAIYQPEVHVFLYKQIKSVCQIQPDQNKITVINYHLKDEEAIKESETLKGNLYNAYNYFFPQKELIPFRVINKNKPVQINNQTYSCTVVEGMDGDTKIKYWMINNMPGIFAKIIIDNNNSGTGFYQIIKLTGIKKR